MKFIVWIGAALALLGFLGLAVPSFTTSQTKDVAKLGDLKVQANEQTTHIVPEFLSTGVLILGFALIAAGAITKN